MSIEALSWAFRQPLYPSSRKFVLVALADYANEANEAYPSIRALSEKTCLDRKTVLDSLATLVEQGIIVDTTKRTGETASVKVYRIVKTADTSCPNTGTACVAQAVPIPAPLTPENNRSSPESGTASTGGSSPVFSRSSPVFSGKQSQKRDTDPSLIHQEPPIQAGACVPNRPVPGGCLVGAKPKDKGIKKTETFTLPEDLATPEAVKAWEEWQQHRKEKRCSLTPGTAKRQIALRIRWGEAKWIASIEQSISQGWQGLFEPRGGMPTNGASHSRAGSITAPPEASWPGEIVHVRTTIRQ